MYRKKTSSFLHFAMCIFCKCEECGFLRENVHASFVTYEKNVTLTKIQELLTVELGYKPVIHAFIVK